MPRILLLILLLTVVYSWEELKYLLVVIYSRFSKKQKHYQKNLENDELVSDIILVATIPLSLAYLLLAEGPLNQKLFVIIAEILIVGLILKGLEEYRFRKYFTQHYEGSDRLPAIIFSLLGLVSPSWQFATRAVPRNTNIGKYLLVLILPLVLGLVLVSTVENLGFDAVQEQLNVLIVIATLGLILNLTIEILEHMFRYYNLQFFSLMRIIVGIAIIFVLTKNF